MVGDDGPQMVEPEEGETGENPALVGNGRRHHHVEGGDTVARHHQQVVVEPVEIAHLALCDQFEIVQRHHERLFPLRAGCCQPGDEGPEALRQGQTRQEHAEEDPKPYLREETVPPAPC